MQGARHFFALFCAVLTLLGAALAMLHVMLAAFFGAGVAGLRAEAAGFRRKLRIGTHEQRGRAAKHRAVAIELGIPSGSNQVWSSSCIYVNEAWAGNLSRGFAPGHFLAQNLVCRWRSSAVSSIPSPNRSQRPAAVNPAPAQPFQFQCIRDF